MTGRAPLIEAFLESAGWQAAARAPLAGDASNRRYLRLHREDGERDGDGNRTRDAAADSAPRQAVLMDAPPERGEDISPFVVMTDWLRARGLSAPALLARDAASGLLLLEDLGDALFARHVVAHPDAEASLYAAAVDLLARLGGHPPPDWLAPYDAAVLGREAALFTEWWLPAAGRPPSPDAAADFTALVAEATAPAANARDTVVLRDYHAENLIWLPERAGDARVGLLDYQDALAGHAAYDLVSLLEDARRDTSADLRDAMLARYLAARPDLDPGAFRAAYAALGAQRNLKIVGIFARLAVRDRKPRYLSLIPRVWGHLQRDLAGPAMAPLALWIARHAPPPEPATLARIAAQVAEPAP